VIVAEVGPLARELRQTLRLCRAETGVVPAQVVLVGGASRLRGLVNYLGEQLALPVRTLDMTDADKLFGPKLAAAGVAADTGCLALAVAMEGGSGRPAFNLRQGELAFKADLSFLRAKAMQIAAIALVVVAFAAGNAYASLHRLRKSEAALDERLARESQQTLGQSMEAWEVLEKAEPKKREESPLPKWTAYDVLLEVSHRVPAKPEITLDVSDIDIKPGKVTLRATTATTAEVEALKKKLREQKCFDDISDPSISAGPNDVKSFSLTIKTTCF
jgi:general secretion pathway protein L